MEFPEEELSREDDFMGGMKMAAQFALMPNNLGHCGSDWFAGVFGRYIAGKAEAWEVKNELRNFDAHFGYLRLIAECNNLKLFDRKVVEAFWLGNRLLEKVERKDMQRLLIEEFKGNGTMTERRTRELAANLPEGTVPHHSFHVLYIGSLNGKFRPSPAHANRCLVRSGRIREVEGEVASVESWSLTGRRTEKLLLSINGIRHEKDWKKGELVGHHWGMASAKITAEQERNLVRYTVRNLEAVKKRSRNVVPVPAYSTSL